MPKIMHRGASLVFLHPWKLEKLPYDLYSVGAALNLIKQYSSIIIDQTFKGKWLFYLLQTAVAWDLLGEDFVDGSAERQAEFALAAQR